MKQKNFRRNASSAARLAAVQALYEVDVAGATVEYVLASFKEQRWASVQAELETEVTDLKEGGVHLPAPDRRVLPSVVRGVDSHRSDLDPLISAQMEAEDAFQQLDAIAKAILRSAAFELAQISEGGIGRACAGLDELLEPVRVHLVPALSDEFVVGVLGGVAKRLEAAIRKVRFVLCALRVFVGTYLISHLIRCHHRIPHFSRANSRPWAPSASIPTCATS